MKKFVLALLLLALALPLAPLCLAADESDIPDSKSMYCWACNTMVAWDYNNKLIERDDYHYPEYLCWRCGAITIDTDQIFLHSGGTATCTQKARCAFCNVRYGSLAEHSWSDELESVDNQTHGYPCTEEGCSAYNDVQPHEYIESWNLSDPSRPIFSVRCAQCNFSRTIGSDVTPEVFPATCELPERQIYNYIIAIGVSLDAIEFSNSKTVTVGAPLGHDYQFIKTVAATCLTDGYTLEKCTRCDSTRKTGVIEAPGHYYGEWSYDGEGTHSAICLRCEESAARECTEGEYCLVCGSGEYEFVEGAFATGETPARGEICVRYLPEIGYSVVWEYNGKIEPLTAPLTVSVPTAPDVFITFTIDAEGFFSIEQ